MSPSQDLWDLAHQRRSVRQIAPADISPDTVERILEMARWAPSSVNSQPWHFVVVREGLAGLWDAIEAAGRAARQGRPVEKFLERVAWYRHASLAILIFMDRQIVEHVLTTRPYISAENTESWALQALGMAQLLIWLGLTDAGLSASLHHFDMEERAILDYLGMPYPRMRLMATMPIGVAAHEVTPPPRRPLEAIVSYERWQGE